MNHKPLDTDDSLENDAVWKLLDQATPASPGPRFVDDTVRAARLMQQPESWWKRWFSPLPLAGLAAATAVCVFTLVQVSKPVSKPVVLVSAFESEQASEIQEVAKTETLIAAVDHLDDFSDNELVSLIGF